MNDELTARQRAISLRLAGRPVKAICAAVGRSDRWFHKWWGRYLEAGPEGLYDLTRANHHVAQRIPPELERAIVSVRRRLQAHASPATRYRLTGATVIRAELKALGIRPLPRHRPRRRAGPRRGPRPGRRPSGSRHTPRRKNAA
jgi:Homeodomain-like domain